ncbi:hypothetical protein [Plesiocystis pacifica]|uniref:hypothetical protein n=1 Tax=Plesiocystis pacifica TaxID=191768 RepID=UPI0018DBEDE5|nr:hypothetical protein [Plesiocystis pacifica]
MTERRRLRVAAALAALGLAGLVVAGVAWTRGGGSEGSARGELPPEALTDTRGQWAEVVHYGAIPSRPVDPASPGFEGREDDDWQELSADERRERAERAVEEQLAVIEASVDEAEREQLRARAFMDLSAARAEFFATEAGERRYLELELRLEG